MKLPRSIAYCVDEIHAMVELLRRNFGLRHAAAAAEQVEMISLGLETAMKDEHLLEHLHAFNDWVQLSLISLTDELGYAFFGYPRAPEKPAQLQGQSQLLLSSQIQGNIGVSPRAIASSNIRFCFLNAALAVMVTLSTE